MTEQQPRQFTPAEQRLILARAHRDELQEALQEAHAEVEAAKRALAAEQAQQAQASQAS